MATIVVLTVVIDNDGKSVDPYIIVNPYHSPNLHQEVTNFGSSIEENKAVNEIHQNLLRFAENMKAAQKKRVKLDK